jgi:hypothetical protein
MTLPPRDFKSLASTYSATQARQMEAAPGFEPGMKVLQTFALPLGDAAQGKKWSGKRDLNPRPLPWQGNALPLSYSRLC